MKIDQAKQFIKDAISKHRNPAVLCSFGKDSVLMTYLALSVKPDLPVIFFRHSYNPLVKYRYADKMIQWFGEQFNPQVIQGLLPSQVELIDQNGDLDFIEHYPIGARTMAMPVGIKQDEGGICSKDKIFNQMKGSYDWSYDLLFCGHKACDEDTLVDGGKIPITIDYLQIQGSSTLAYPLRNFSHAEVFNSFSELNIPMDTERYEKTFEVWAEKEDKTVNGDWTTACMNCMNPYNDKTVYCPKLKANVNNLGRELLSVNQLNNLEYLKQ